MKPENTSAADRREFLIQSGTAVAAFADEFSNAPATQFGRKIGDRLLFHQFQGPYWDSWFVTKLVKE